MNCNIQLDFQKKIIGNSRFYNSVDHRNITKMQSKPGSKKKLCSECILIYDSGIANAHFLSIFAYTIK